MKAVYLGRFQPFHEGHRGVIDRYREEFEEFVIVIGSADKSREQENPLTFEERKEIIEGCYPELEILPLEDEGKTEEGNRKWAAKLEEKTGGDAVISRNSLVQELVREHTSMEVEEPDKIGPDSYSGTEVRRRIQSGEEWRYLVPDCCKEEIDSLTEVIEEVGIEYEFEPGWKKENAYHSTAD